MWRTGAPQPDIFRLCTDIFQCIRLQVAAVPGGDQVVDQETQARLEALLEAAGISRLTGESKQLADPEILRRLTSSVR